MRFVVLGAGLQGSACAYDLLQGDAADRVILADQRIGELPRFLSAYRDDPRLEQIELDARDHEAVLAAFAQADACMNALPYFFNLDMARLAVRAGVHYADLGGNTEIVFDQLELGEQAREAGVSVIPDCGLAPGMVNILAVAAIRALDETDSVKIRVGGLPREPEPPLNYQVVYSLQGVLDYYTTPSWIVRDGQRQQVDALSEVREIDFPEPAGRLEAFHTGGGLSTLPWKYAERIPTMEYKTLRYPGHAAIMRAIRDLGLLDLEPVQVGDAAVRPRDLFIACAGPRLSRRDAPDLVALRVEVRGRRDGVPHAISYELLDFFDETTGISAMERTTGFSLAITGRMQADGQIAGTGAFTPDDVVPVDSYLQELKARGIDIRRTDRY